jgi:hypothetical protein
VVGDCFTTGCTNFIDNLLCGTGISASAVYCTAEVIDHDKCSA